MSDRIHHLSVRSLAGICVAVLCLVAGLPARAQVDTTGSSTADPTTATPRIQLSPFGEAFPYDAYRHSITFDSVSNRVRIQESVFGTDLGVTQTLTLDEFLVQRRREQERRMWEERARSYEMAKGGAGEPKDALEKIIGKTQIDIPIPQNPISTWLGAPSISLNVVGSVNVSAGWQWDNNNLTSISALGSTQSAPFFNQNINVAVSGKVGDKLKLNADFDTQRTIDLDNQLKIAFGGGPESDDDIIQGFELGNVQLQNAGSLIGGSTTLFGAKANFKFGPLFLTTIASQKRGEKKTVTVSGGSVKSQISIKPYDYAQNHFWLDTVYKGFYDDFFLNNPPSATPAMAPHNVVDIEVYEQVKDGSIPSQFKAIAYADLPPADAGGRYNPATIAALPVSGSGIVQRGSWRKLNQGSDFELNRQLGTLTIRSLQIDKAYAVAYRTEIATYGVFSNTRSESDTAYLKLVYVTNMQPSFRTLWARQMKNIYPLQGVRNVDITNSRIKITFGVPPDTSEIFRISGSPRIVTALGVDRINSSNQPTPDGEFDIRSQWFFDPSRGEIIFPSSEPFRRGLIDRLQGDAGEFVLDAIYDRTRDEAQRDTRSSKYTIGGEIAGSGGNRILLEAFYLSPGSVKVYSNGEQLIENVDYRVSFNEITLLSAKANNAAGNISVEYEQNDFATVANKTLVGIRADYDLLRRRNLRSRLGMTLMRYGQSLPTDKVQIYSGDESVANLMVGFDGSLEYNAPFITKAIDALPLIDTKEPSAFTVRGEWAMVMPNPNTKPSLVSQDGGRGAAYIDDFESGAKRQIPLGVSYTTWHPSSPPLDTRLGLTDSARLAVKRHFYWYNRTPATTETKEIWEDKETTTSNSKTTVLDLVFDPTKRGMYNMNDEFVPEASWGGMMRSLSFYAANLDEENIDYIEIMMKVDQNNDRDAALYIDLGQVSEDVIPNFDLNTEDGITPTNPQQDDVLNEGEDVGFDGLNDAQEQERWSRPGEEDPARDNFFFNAFGSNQPDDYKWVNGVEKNVSQERAPIPDSEDLNGNKSVDVDNSYFQYRVDLNTDANTNPQIAGNGNNRAGWRLYRIPIRSNYTTVGNPSFANIQFVRVWVKSRDSVRIRIAEFNLTGSDWRNYNAMIDSASDPKLDIAFVGVQDNSGAPEFYSTPPGVNPDIDPSTQIVKDEQSLSITVRNLERGEYRAAARVRPRAFDVFNYKQMKFFLHGGGDMDAVQIPGQPAKVVAFMRFGWDSLNYYEYRVPLLRGWNDYTINFADLAAIKQAGTLQNRNVKRFSEVPGQPDADFAILGNPSLTRIQFIAFGVENQAYPLPLTTTMWVNELRVVGAEDENDWAGTLTTQLKLADLGSINANVNRYNPNFHRLEERFGNRIQSTDWAINSVFQLDKFLPNAFKGSSIPLTYNHIERVQKPRYISESDVEVNAAADRILRRTDIDPVERTRQADYLRLATETLVVQDALAFSNFKLAFPGDMWWVKDILNRLNFGFDYNQIRERSPLVEQRFRWEWNFRGQYAVNIPPNFDLQPFKKIFATLPVLDFWKDFKINFLPSTLSANTDIHRERQTEQLRDILDPSPVQRDFRATRRAAFNWRLTEGGLLNIATDYDLNVNSTLTHLETDEFGQQRSSKDITSELFFDEGRLFNFGRDNELNQSFTFNARPRIPFIPNADRYFRISTARYVAKYNWVDALPSFGPSTSTFTKTAKWNSTATLGLDIPLIQIGDALFGDATTGGARKPDTTESEGTVTSILRYLIKIPFLEFETLRFQFKQDNASINPGVVGSTGVSNLWGRSLLFRSESPDFGPGAAYQLGLTSHPHGKLDFGLKPSFPFIDVKTEKGIRAPNIYVQDNYNQKSNLTMSTDRKLWPGASLTLNWGVEWGYNQNYSILTDANGVFDAPRNVLTTSNLNRTYLSLPDFLLFSAFSNDIDGVVEEYGRRRNEVTAPDRGAFGTNDSAYNVALTAYNTRITEILSETFEEQLEALNWLPGEIRTFLPRVNWVFNWNGLEKLPFLSDWAQSVSIQHAYSGKFNRNYRESDQGRVPETQTVSRGFSPLLRINVSGKPDVFNGSMTGAFTYNTTTNFALVTAARAEISKELNNEMQLQVGYQRRGMKLPLFGTTLKNDIEFQLSCTYTRTNRKRFNLTDFRPEGNNDGSTRINLRPSVRYTLSNTVTALGFVSYEATIPDDEGSRDIKRSTTKVGIELRIGISGGR